jgi:hypothetical protein
VGVKAASHPGAGRAVQASPSGRHHHVQPEVLLTDGDQTIELHWDFGDMHNQYLTFAHLPKQRILVEADDFSAWYATPLSLAMWNNLYGNLARLRIDPLIMAPLHGPISPMDEWVKVLRDETAKLGAD